MQETISFIHKHAPNFVPKVGMILGSGLGSIADQLTRSHTIPYQAIPGLASGRVAGHASLLMLGYLQDIPVACLKGRLHRYEGASYESIKTLVRMVKLLGAESLIVTCAAGSLRNEVKAGEVMMISDHINFHPGNPLMGANDESFGERFVSLENAYDAGLREQFKETAKKLAIPVTEGVYISVLGPTFETPAEIKMFQQWGADAIGMSVVPEVIVARHCGLKVLGLAAITNLAVGLSHEMVTHEGTLRYGEITARKLTKLIPQFIQDTVSV